MTIPPHDISVVVQGPVVGGYDQDPAMRLTNACLESLRRHLPGAELILSTWKGSDIRGLNTDIVIQNADPGSVSYFRNHSAPYNLNRQLLSTSTGLARATRPFALKIRSDMRIDGLGFLELFNCFPKRNPNWQVFGERVVICDLLTQHPWRTGFAFSPSDWFTFGKTDDVRLLWAAQMDSNHEVARYFENRPRPSPLRMPEMISRYNAEQYIWLHALRTHAPVSFNHGWDASASNKRLAELAFANNLVIADESRLGVRFCKYRPNRLARLVCYTHQDWLDLYRRYCDPAYPAGWMMSKWSRHVIRLAEIYARKACLRLPKHLRWLSGPLGRNE